jgi:serine/threonine-protein kinase RIO1
MEFNRHIPWYFFNDLWKEEMFRFIDIGESVEHCCLTSFHITKHDTISIYDFSFFRKAARATLVLIPLLGIQYLILPMRPSIGSSLEDAYTYGSAILMSCQVSTG